MLQKFSVPLIIILTIVLLHLVSIFTSDTELFGIELTEFNLFSDFTEIEDESLNINTQDKSKERLKAGLFSNVTLPEAGNYSFLQDQIDQLVTYPAIEGNRDQLKYFFEALKKADKKLVRIAYLGDSIIEGDYITAEFRDRLQNKFGGSGLGYQAITSADSRFRLTSEHIFSDNWDSNSLFARSKKDDFALNGEVFIPSSGSSVSYKLLDHYKSGSGFDKLRIMYEEKSGSDVNISFDGAATKKHLLKKTDGIDLLEVSPDVPVTEVGLEFEPSGSTRLLGIFLDSGTGIQVDSYPYRGNNGNALAELSPASLKQMNRLLDYKLILLQFGLNAAAMQKSRIKKLEAKIIEGINLLKAAFPETSIIFIGVSDKSKKKGSSFVTDPVIPELISMQKKIADDTGIAFWNTYEAMGGKNSMAKWVKNKPAYAHSDFIHFNKTGADMIGDILSKVLIDEYSKHSK